MRLMPRSGADLTRMASSTGAKIQLTNSSLVKLGYGAGIGRGLAGFEFLKSSAYRRRLHRRRPSPPPACVPQVNA